MLKTTKSIVFMAILVIGVAFLAEFLGGVGVRAHFLFSYGKELEFGGLEILE